MYNTNISIYWSIYTYIYIHAWDSQLPYIKVLLQCAWIAPHAVETRVIDFAHWEKSDVFCGTNVHIRALQYFVTKWMKYSSSTLCNAQLNSKSRWAHSGCAQFKTPAMHRCMPVLKHTQQPLRDSAFHKFNYLQNLWSLTPNLKSIAGHRLLKNKVSMLPKQWFV